MFINLLILTFYYINIGMVNDFDFYCVQYLFIYFTFGELTPNTNLTQQQA